MSLRLFLIIIIALLTVSSIVTAQPQIDLLRLYDRDGTPVDFLADIYHTTDRGYYVCGQSAYDPWVFKLDGEGDLQWEYSEDGVRLFSIIEADNGDAVSVGSIGDGMYGAVRLDSDGERVWRREFIRGRATAVIELKEGSFLICGRMTDVEGDRYGYVVLLSPDGETIWARRYGNGDANFYFESMRETDNGVVLAGWTSGESTQAWAVKIDPDEGGEVIWSRIYELEDDQRFYRFFSIVSTDFGFAIGGGHGAGDGGFGLTFINGDGELLETHLYENGAFLECLDKLSDDGYVLVGYNSGGLYNRTYPEVLRTDANGNINWTKDFSEIVDQQPRPNGTPLHNQLYSVIVIPDDVIVACGVMYNNEVRNRLEDGLVVRLEPDQPQPIIFYWLPEDTVFTTLFEDTVDFVVRARDQQGDELEYEWWSADTLMGRDTTVAVFFDEMREYNIECRVSDDDWTSAVSWRVNITSFYIDSYSPDTLELTCRRDTSVEFSVSARAVEVDPVQYAWFLDGDEIADRDSVSIIFGPGREHSVSAVATQGELSDSVTWQILINDLIVDYTPERLDLSVPVDTSFEFEVFPFNPEDDSLRIVWTVNGDSVWNRSWLLMNFDEEGMFEITAHVSDTTESDSMTWEVNVEPNSVNTVAPRHPNSPTLLTPSPNPFNSQTTVRYYLPSAGEVRLELYDVSGRLVKELANQRGSAGYHSVVVNGGELVSGVYFVRMDAGRSVSTQKLLLLK